MRVRCASTASLPGTTVPDLTPRGGDNSNRDLADALAIAIASVDPDTLSDAIDVATETALDESVDIEKRAQAFVVGFALRAVERGASFDDVRAQLEPFTRNAEPNP